MGKYLSTYLLSYLWQIHAQPLNMSSKIIMSVFNPQHWPNLKTFIFIIFLSTAYKTVWFSRFFSIYIFKESYEEDKISIITKIQ